MYIFIFEFITIEIEGTSDHPFPRQKNKTTNKQKIEKKNSQITKEN